MPVQRGAQKHRNPIAAPPPGAAPGGLAVLALCFFFSGAASLVLEVVWTRLLRLVFGSTTLAVSTILVAYMLGLGFGGLLGARWAKRLRHPVRAYGWIEIGIGLYALLVPTAMHLLPAVDRALTGSLSFWPIAFCRFVVAVILLLAPTIGMGATLPILTEAVARRHGGAVRHVGLLYGLNTLGAVAGTLGATFVLLPAVGAMRTSFTAAMIGLGVGALSSLWLAPRLASPPPTAAKKPTAAAATSIAWNAPLIAYGVVGFTSLSYEVCWTRALSMILGSSIYSFATMLASFLTGIALGSLAARRWADRVRDPVHAYAIGIALLGILSLTTIAAFRLLPSLFVDVVHAFGTSPAGITATNLTIAGFAMLAPTLVLGALFPLLVRTQAGSAGDTSRAVGAAYFSNTIGSAAGAFTAGFVLIPTLGLQHTLALAVALNLACAGVLFLSAPRTARRRAFRFAAPAAALVGAAVVVFRPPTWSPEELSRGVYKDPELDPAKLSVMSSLVGMPREGLLYYREGINTTVSVHRIADIVFLRVNGKTDASTAGDMNTQVLSGQIPFLFGSGGKRVLVIGLASGVSVGSAGLHQPDLLEVVELEPAMVEASRFFDHANHRPFEQPAVRLRVDDGRAVVLMARAEYDVIISEPSNPWITGASNLFTREYFAGVRRALRPGGELLQWIQFYAMSPDSFAAIIASLTAEFPYVYGFARDEGSGDLLLLARDRPLAADDLPRWERLPAAVRDDLTRIGLFSTADLWTLLRLGADDIRQLAQQATSLNTDDNMLVELAAPWALYRDDLASANIALVESVKRGVVPVLQAAGVEISAETAGELALSYAQTQDDPLLATKTLDFAGAHASNAAASLARVVLGDAEPTGDTGSFLRQLAESEPTAFAPQLELARLLFASDRPAEALGAAESALALRPDDPRARLLRVQSLRELGRAAQARPEADALARSGFAHLEPNVLSEAAIAAEADGDLPTAIDYFRAYVLRRPLDPTGWYGLASFLDLAGRSEEAAQATENQRSSERVAGTVPAL